jgi:WD40 repeat protein
MVYCVQGVVHLLMRQQIITCSRDGSLRLWDSKSGSQIGEDWKEEGDKKVVVNNIALSPSGKTVVIGSNDRKMRFLGRQDWIGCRRMDGTH